MKVSVATVLAVLVAAALFVAGCGGGGSEGSSSTGQEGGAKKATAPNAPAGSKVISCSGGAMQLRATALDCGTARTTMQHWERSHACGLGGGDSRGSCSLGGFRCQAVKVDRGVAVSCAKPGADVAFLAKG